MSESNLVNDFLLSNPNAVVVLFLGLGVITLLLLVINFLQTFMLNDSVSLSRLKKAGLIIQNIGFDVATAYVNSTPSRNDNEFLLERLNEAGYIAYIDDDGNLIITAKPNEDDKSG